MWHWGDILEENVDVGWHSFLFLKTSCDTLDLKLKGKWNLWNIHSVGEGEEKQPASGVPTAEEIKAGAPAVLNARPAG
jgi:hypothetical protein